MSRRDNHASGVEKENPPIIHPWQRQHLFAGACLSARRAEIQGHPQYAHTPWVTWTRGGVAALDLHGITFDRLQAPAT